MNKSIKALKTILVMAISGAFFTPAAEAVTVKEFYTIPENKQFSFLTDTINEMCGKLQDRFDGKGQRKSPELLKKQRDFAYFIIKLFDAEDSTGLRVSYAKIDSLIYSASLDEADSKLHVETIILNFALERYKEKLAADAARNQSPSVTP